MHHSECQRVLDTAFYFDMLILRQESLQAKLACVIQSWPRGMDALPKG